VEVDLETLKVVSQEKFPFSIAVISEAKHTTPITVGTNLSLHLHDPRANLLHSAPSDAPERLDDVAHMPGAFTPGGHFNLQPHNYSPLFHPGPLSIVHIPTSPDCWDTSGEIYVAGRFSSILNYDRRYFPKLRSTIFSGARLCSMTSIPYPFAAQWRDPMRRGELSIEQIDAAKAELGNTLIACGEYNSKGSLELYGLSPPLQTSRYKDVSDGKAQTPEPLKNRQTSSNSKLLSVSNHGTRIVFSDGGGNIKWVERNGFTGVRDWNIGRGSVEGPRGIFGTLGDSYMDTSSGDIARKILHSKSDTEQNQNSVDKDDLILWTGEKLALLSFSSKPGFTAESFEEKAKSAEEAMKEREERVYGQTMKRALKMQADEVRFVTGLGLGFR
jgi:hypothetical protein